MTSPLRGLLQVVCATAIVIRSAAIAHGDPDKPLRPRFETPAEREARTKRPRFLKPSEKGSSRPDAPVVPAAPPLPPEGPAVVAIASPSVPPWSFATPQAYSYLAGSWRDWTGETLLQRPSVRVDTLADDRARGTLFVRGFYTALDKGRGDWSGAELIGSIDITKRVAIAAALRHELRDTIGNEAVVSLSTLLTRDVALLTTFGAGNGVDYLPVTMLGAETRVRVTELQQLQYAFGVGASWWSETRRLLHADAAGIFKYSPSFSAEYRLQFNRVDSDTTSAHVFPRTTLTFLEGTDGRWLIQERLTIGQAPLDSFGVDVADQPYKLSANLALGLRKWVAPTYGYIVGLESGYQRDGYRMFGVDISVFVQR